MTTHSNPNESSKRKKRFYPQFVFASVLAVPILIIGAWIHLYSSGSSAMISAGNTSELVGRNYQSVVEELTDAGFRNIEAEQLIVADSSKWEEGVVSTVSIGGDEQFEQSDLFDSGSKVVVKYH